MKKLNQKTVQIKLPVKKTNGPAAYEAMIKGYIYDRKDYSKKIEDTYVYSESAKIGNNRLIR